MARPIVKYLDPISGEYEFATVVDIGDLRNLNTTIKSDIVGAINSIVSGGVHNPITDEKVEDLERIINSLKDGTFNIEDFGSIDEYLKQQFLDELDRLNAQNKAEMESVLTQLDTSVDDAIRDYQERVAAQNIILENAENTLADARGTLEAKAAELETAQIGLSELETEFNKLDNYISTNVRTIDFDNFNAMVEDYETVVTQTSDEVGVDMSGSTLSYLTGRVTDAEANISAQAGEISSKMSYDEFQYMPVPKYSYGENLLFDTFDFGDAWNGKNGAQVTTDTFLFGKVVAFNSPTGLYETRTDDLTIGESYVLSTYVNVQPSSKKPSEGRYEPVSSSYDPTDFTVQIGGASFNPGVYEDLSGINGWVRINQEFVADAVNPIISITPTGVNSQNEIAYMAMPKLEKELTVTPWQPHLEDKYATMSSTQSMMKQQANSITAFVTGVEELDESYRQATSTFQMLADGFKANTEAVEAYEDTVSRYGTEYSNINGKFEQKVWKDDFDAAIEDINIDNRNRVLNSDFIRNEISSSDRRLIVEDWSLNSDWEIKTIDDNKYLSRDRTGLTQNLITSASSNYFPVRDKERVLFGFDLIHSGLDNDKVFAIELFDISDKRLLKEEFSLSSLTKVGNRYHGSFNISTPGVQKGKVVLQLPRNGSVSFTKISFQNADIGSIDWSPAPEDSWIIQSKLETYISQVEDEVTIGGVGRKIDTLTGLLTEDKGTFTLNPDKIATEVFNSETYDDMGFVNKTNFEQTADGWIQEITDKGRLAGYINASPDTYRISFDKIMLEGTTWADRLGSSKIMVTENFALIGKNGRPVLDVNNDGSINMNVSKMNIGAYQAATKKDIEDIELTPGPRGKDAVTVSLETLTSAYEYTADGKLGPVKSTSIQAWHNDVLSGTVYYEFIVNGSTKQNTTNGQYMYKAPESYSDMPQTVEVKIREGSNSSNVLATDFITIVGIKPGLDGGDAYTIMLDNESHTFGGDVSNALASSLDIEVISYKGTDRIIASVGAISGLPSGMTVSVVNNNTVSPKISFTVKTSMTSPNGTITIPITVDGKVFNKIFTYSISFKGDNGKDGVDGVDGYTPIKGVDYFDGNDGISIVNVKEYYLASDKDAGITITGYDWKETFQPISETKPYLWNYEKVEYSDGLSDTFGPNLIGHYATDGEKGEAGRGIASIVEYYLASPDNSGVIVRGNKDWSTTFQQTTPTNRYLWNYEEITYTDGLTDIIGPSIIGTHGAKGDSPIVAYLTNDSHMIPTDEDGLNQNYDNAYTEMRIMDGIKDDTDSYKFSVQESSGVAGKIKGNKYTVTSLNSDVAEVNIIATKGSFTINKVFTVTKSKKGIKGTDGAKGDDSTLYQLNTDTLVVIKDIDDVYSQDSVSLTSVMKVGSEDYKNNPVYFRVYEQKINPLTVDTFSELSMKDQVDNREYVLSLYGKPRLLQYESFIKESHIDYKLSTDIMSIFVEIYEDKNFTKIIDSQSIAVIAEPKPNYKLEIHSTNGNSFVNGVINTEMYVTLYRGEDDITDSTDAKHFIWTRVSNDKNSDTAWNNKYKAGAKKITVTKDDVNVRARFSCNFVK